MSRRWKQGTTMFVFVMMAMVSTILTVNSTSESSSDYETYLTDFKLQSFQSQRENKLKTECGFCGVTIAPNKLRCNDCEVVKQNSMMDTKRQEPLDNNILNTVTTKENSNKNRRKYTNLARKSCPKSLKRNDTDKQSYRKQIDRKHTDSYEDALDVPKQNSRKKLKRWSSGSEFETDVEGIEQKLKKSASLHSENKNPIDENTKFCDSTKSEIQPVSDIKMYEVESNDTMKDKVLNIDNMPSLNEYQNVCPCENQVHLDFLTSAAYGSDNDDDFALAVEKDGKELEIGNKDFINKIRGPIKMLWPTEKEANHKSEFHTEIKRSTQNEQILVGDTNNPAKVKKENLFQHFPADQDVLKNTLIHATREISFERIPVINSSDESAYVTWNVNVKEVVDVHIKPDVQDCQTERLKFINDVFSRIPNAESPTAYDFYFDLTGNYKLWFMLAVHKQNNHIFGRRWEYLSKTSSKTIDWAPCDARNRWIKRFPIVSTDRISKALLKNGFNFAPCDTQNLKRKRKPLDFKAKSESPEQELPGDIPDLQDDQEKRAYRKDVENAQKMKQKQCEYNLACALESKFEESAMFLLSSFDLNKEVPPSLLESGNFMVLTQDSSCFSWNNVKKSNDLEEWTPFLFVLDDKIIDEMIKKAFNSGLSEPFTLMMEFKNWPENLWNHVLESETKQSKEMVQLICERISEFEQTKHLSILLKANDNGKIPFFEKIMHLADLQDKKTTKHLKYTLKENFPERLHQLYQYLLFFGVAKADKNLVEFALSVPHKYRASLQEKTDGQIASAMENKCSWRKKGKSNSSEEGGYQKKENPIEPTEQESMEDIKKFDQITAIKQEDKFATTKTENTILPVKKELTEDNFDLENKTALEIATMLLYNSQEASRSDKQNLRFIKSLLENEAKPDFKVKKVKPKVETISLSD